MDRPAENLGRGRQKNRQADLGEATILYRDEFLLAVDKPGGIIVHGDGTGAMTLTDIVRGMLLSEGVDMSQRDARGLQPLQRLDRDTSGIVLFSLSKETQAEFDRMIAQRMIEKRYLAIVHGWPKWDERTFRQPIGRDRHDARRMRASKTGKPALTIAHAIERTGQKRPVTLLEVDLKTGRKHQIRVHLSTAGFPIVGDTLYGRPGASEARGGLMLHAASVSFTHPITGDEIRISSPTPLRFKELLAR